MQRKESWKDITTILDSKFSKLPDEIILQIFSYLNIRDLLTTSCVDRRWHQLSEDSSLLTKLSLNGHEISSTVAGLLLKRAPRLKSLQIIRRRDANDLLTHVYKYNRKLESLTIKGVRGEIKNYWVSENTMCQIQRHLKYLQYFNLKNYKFEYTKFFTQLDRTLPALKKFRFQAYDGPVYKENFIFFHKDVSILEELKCRCWDITEFNIRILANKFCDTLVLLKLDAFDVTDQTMQEISRCHKLRTLQLYYAQSITGVGLQKISKLQLHSLLLTFAYLITTDSWMKFFASPNSKYLRKIVVSACPSISDNVLETIASNCEDLEKISVPYCNEIEGFGFSSIFKHGKAIRYINIYQTAIKDIRNYFLSKIYCCVNLETLVLSQNYFEIADDVKILFPKLNIVLHQRMK